MTFSFKAKYGHDATEHGRIMVADTLRLRREQATLEASLVRAGRVAPGQTDVMVRPATQH